MGRSCSIGHGLGSKNRIARERISKNSSNRQQGTERCRELLCCEKGRWEAVAAFGVIYTSKQKGAVREDNEIHNWGTKKKRAPRWKYISGAFSVLAFLAARALGKVEVLK